MNRREVIAAIGGAGVAAWPQLAQPADKTYRIGVLETIPLDLNKANWDALLSGLREAGFVEGRNLLVEYRSADGRGERFAALAAELVDLKVDLIVTRGTPAAVAARDATISIPVVMAAIGDPLTTGVVRQLARPGGNITGLSAFVTELQGKRVELIKELLPGTTRVGALLNMGNPVAPPQWDETISTARRLGIEPELVDVRRAEDLAAAFETAISSAVDTLAVGIDVLTQANRAQIVELARRHKLPAIYPSREFTDEGGLVSYGVSYPDLYRRAASFIARILKGAKPADIPVEQPTKLELVLNLKTASALGLDIPPSFLARADEVIE